MPSLPELTGEAEAVIIIKASPNVGERHGETVCCAGLDDQGNWLRLYPISFRQLDDSKKFRRWDRVRFRWRKPKDDNRKESRRVDDQSLQIIGHVPEKERARLVLPNIADSLKREFEEKRSLAFIKPEITKFVIEKKTDKELDEEQKKLRRLSDQGDLFNQAKIVPLIACPYKFKYPYNTLDGKHVGTCQDWESEAAFFLRRKEIGEERALQFMRERFGEELVQKGVIFAMGTHSLYPETWLLNGLITVKKSNQTELDI